MTAPTFDRPGQLERPQHDWTRDDTGRPWVLPDPDWAPERTAAWLGSRAQDGRVPYTRVTTFVEALLEGTALGKWKMRRVALGMGRRPDYVVAAAALTAEDRDKAALNDLAEKALEAAGPNAADIGTALHQFTERIDRGEPLGFVPDQYARDLDAYREQVQRLTWLHREERMVCDLLETAGTPDGIALVDEPDPDGVVGVPRIVDLKTGNVAYTAGKFSAQLGTYANSQLYDARTGARTPVPDLDTRWGLVLHMPAGLGTAELRWLNLEHGWLGAQLSGPIRKWRTVTHGDLLRPLVRPEPRQVPDGKCAGRKRDGQPCTNNAKADGFCGRHSDQVGTDPDAAVSERTRAAMDVVRDALQTVPEPLRTSQPATVVLEDDALLNAQDLQQHPDPESTSVEPAVETELEQTLQGVPQSEIRAPDVAPEHQAGTQPHWFVSSTGDSGGLCLNCRLERKAPDAQHLGVIPEAPDDAGPDHGEAMDVAAAIGRCGTTDLLVDQCACPVHRPDLQETARLLERGEDGPRELPTGELNGNPRPHASLSSPDDAAAAARKAEQSLLDQVRACRTSGELEVLWQSTGQAWTPAVRAAATEQHRLLPELAQAERVDAALLAAIADCRSVGDLRRLAELHDVSQWTDEAKAAARKALAELPPF